MQNQPGALMQEIVRALDKVAKHEPDEFTREEELGTEYSLSEVEDEVRGLIELASEFRDTVDIRTFPADRLKELKQTIHEGFAVLKAVLDFTPGQSSPTRSEIKNELRDVHRRWHSAFLPLIAYSKSAEAHPADEIRADVQAAKEDVEQFREEMREYRDEAQEKIEHARKAAEETSVAAHEEWFKGDADSSMTRAGRWRWATVLTAGATLGAAISFLIAVLPTPPDWTFAQSLQVTVAKVAILAVLASAAVWSARMYRASYHNYVVNKHRQNALKTFEAFGDAAEGDEEARRAVLMQATASIFSPQPTGYLQRRSESQQPTEGNVSDLLTRFGNP